MSTIYATYIDGEELEITIHADGKVELDGECFEVDLQHISNESVYSMIVQGQSHEVFTMFENGIWRILIDGERHEVEVEDERTKRLKGLSGSDKQLVGDIQVKAPMPGLVVKVMVEPGEQIEENQPLVILEAMKMENELRAPRSGIVKEVRIKPQEIVALQQVLLILGNESKNESE